MRVRRLRRLWKTAQAVLANVVFGFPGRKLRVIGVTGTDGKTTTVHLIVTALESAGYTVGAVSTIHFQVGTRRWVNTSKLTTPGPWALTRLLAHMVRAGCHYVVIECTSQRLDQNGLWGIPFDVAVITNITREHFDYHRNFADYAAAKRRLFRALRHPPKVLPFREHLDRGGRVPTLAVVNLDDERCVAMLEEPVEKKYGFTLNGEWKMENGKFGAVRVTARRVGNHPQFSTFHSHFWLVRADDHEALLSLKLPGAFNLQNALAAIAVGVSQGIELARITRELSEVERIPGRMDPVDCGQPFTVIVDYAVTPAAFEALYAEVSQLKTHNSKPIHVFGAAGERDRGKRPLLGEIAGTHADLVILTDEDPFNEDPERILDDLEAGLRRVGMRPFSVAPASSAHSSSPASPQAPSAPPSMQTPSTRESDTVNYTTSAHPMEIRPVPVSGVGGSTVGFLRVRDRRLAIREALRRAQPGDVVLVTGKGAEETMAVGSERIPWNDRRVIEEELAVLGFRGT